MQSALPEPTQDERSMALMAHLLQIFTGFFGPLVIYFLRRQSRFVVFHSLQAVFWQLLVTAVSFAGVLLIVVTILVGSPQGSGPPSGGVLAVFVVFWLAMAGLSLLNLAVAVYFTVKASKGEWAENPLVASWARRAAGI